MNHLEIVDPYLDGNQIIHNVFLDTTRQQYDQVVIVDNIAENLVAVMFLPFFLTGHSVPTMDQAQQPLIAKEASMDYTTNNTQETQANDPLATVLNYATERAAVASRLAVLKYDEQIMEMDLARQEQQIMLNADTSAYKLADDKKLAQKSAVQNNADYIKLQRQLWTNQREQREAEASMRLYDDYIKISMAYLSTPSGEGDKWNPAPDGGTMEA